MPFIYKMTYITETLRDLVRRYEHYGIQREELYYRYMPFFSTLFPIVGFTHAFVTLKPSDDPLHVCVYLLGGLFTGMYLVPYYPVVMPVCSFYYLYKRVIM